MKDVAQSPLTRLWRAAVHRFGTDVTAVSARRSALVLAPHPDDETFGCAATIRGKVLACTPVHVVIATDGRHSQVSAVISPSDLAQLRADEAAEALAQLGLGLEAVTFLEFEDGSLSSRQDELGLRVRAAVEAFGPEDVLVTSASDSHPDHVALNRAVRALMPEMGGVRVLEYPTWWWFTGYDWRRVGGHTAVLRWLNGLRALLANARDLEPELVSTADHLAAKRSAIEAYRSQSTNLTGEQSWEQLPDGFLQAFLGRYEVFFPVSKARARRSRARRRPPDKAATHPLKKS